MPPHDSTVSLIAWTDKQASDAASVAVKWTGTAREAPKSKLFAVLVGVSDYDDADLKLNFANEDAKALDALLKAQSGLGFANVETKLRRQECDGRKHRGGFGLAQ